MNLYRYIQALSIDVAIGAIVMSAWVAQCLQVTMHWSVYVSMGLCTWLVYTLDHLMDAKDLAKNAVTFRHSIHVRYFKGITYSWIGVLVGSLLIVVRYLPLQTILFGLGALTIVTIHFVLVYLLGKRISVLVHKELGVALAYAFGVFVGPASYVGFSGVMPWMLFGSIFFIALLNLILFSYFDYEADQNQGQTSIVRGMGLKRSMLLIGFVSVLGLICASYSLFEGSYSLFYVLLAILIALLIMIPYKAYFGIGDRYRILGDGVFLLPAVFLLF